MLTYYFDGSDAAVTDPNAVWTNDANAFDGDTSTSANTSTVGDTSSNYLLAEGTDAPGTGLTITQVKTRIYANSNAPATVKGTVYTDSLGASLGTCQVSQLGYGTSVTLAIPSGGWTWPVIQSLEVKAYCTTVGSGATVARIEIQVFLDSIPGSIYRMQGFQ